MAVASETSVRTMLAGMIRLSAGADGDEDEGIDGLSAFWTPITAQATAKSEAWLRKNLPGTPSAIAKYELFEHYHCDLSLFWCGVYGAALLTAQQLEELNKLDCRAEVLGIESIGDDEDTTDDDLVMGGRMERDDDLFRRPSVNSGGSIPGDIFNTPAAWTYTR